ncbi:MAG: Crp/Fnr family transcriptional regulator [Chloroflexi bacterium]|nr:Crp/Fnr family transcriptional regulator [Chloroflexota bacterium]
MATRGFPKLSLKEPISSILTLFGYVAAGFATAITLVTNGITVILTGAMALIVGVILFPFIAVIAVKGGARRFVDIADSVIDRRLWLPLSFMTAALALTAGLSVYLALSGFLIFIPAVVAAGALFTASIFTIGDFRILVEKEHEYEVAKATRLEPLVDAPPAPSIDVARLWNTDIFRNLSEEQVNAVAGLGTVRRLTEGSPLGEEEKIGEKVYAVLDGKAQLTSNTGLGPVTVRVAGPGEAFPLASLVGYGMLITSAHAMTEMTVWEADRQRLLTFCSEQPEVGSKVFASAAMVLAERYRDTLTRLTQAAELAVEGVETRVTI